MFILIALIFDEKSIRVSQKFFPQMPASSTQIKVRVYKISRV